MIPVVLALLTLMVAAVAVSVAGVLLARDALDRLHFVGPAVLVGGPALIAAVIAGHGIGVEAGRTALVVVILVVATPVLNHATARAAMARGDTARLRSTEPDEPPR